MKIEFKASVLRVTRNKDAIIFEATENKDLKEESKCQVGGSSDDPDNPYCIDNGCDNCVLHSRDLGNDVSEYWCTCE